MRTMEEFVARENIARFRVRLAEAKSASARTVLQGLLGEEQVKLDRSGRLKA